MKSKTRWAKEPEKQDYSAVQTYLSLIYDNKGNGSAFSQAPGVFVPTFKRRS